MFVMYDRIRWGPGYSFPPITDYQRQLVGTDTPSARVRLMTPVECEAAPMRDYILKGFIAPSQIGCIFGEPGAGKSLIAPYLGYAVAQGRKVFGMKAKPGTVFYVAAEDELGMQSRITALKAKHGDAENFKLVVGVSDLFTPNSADLRELQNEMTLHKPSLVFIDTLAMAFPGLEENSSVPMGHVMDIGKKLAKEGAAVIFIHHGTKAEGNTPRGHSNLNGALDIALHLKAKDRHGIVRSKLTKNRNGTVECDIAFKIGVHEIGEDEDGDVVSAAYTDELAQGTVKDAPRLSPSAAAALEVLVTLSGDGGSVQEDAWRAVCIGGRTVSAAESLDSRKKAFKRAAQLLLSAQAVVFENGMYAVQNSTTAFAGQPIGRIPDVL